MRIRILAGNMICGQPGDVVDVARERGLLLVQRGFAEAVDTAAEVETRDPEVETRDPVIRKRSGRKTK